VSGAPEAGLWIANPWEGILYGAFRPEGATLFHLIGFILSGFIVGLIARAIKPGNDSMGYGMTTVLGMAGAVVAGWFGHQVGWYPDDGGAGFVVSTLGAIVILSLFYGITHRRTA
jgi:uncharacterized membrane protein YeaQ/YmgE (transglycosylase-associated protein family)